MYNSDSRNAVCGSNASGRVITPASVGSCSVRRQNARECDCDNGTGRNNWGLANHPLASVYAPLQEFENIYDNETALIRGTIFKELDLPFVCGGMTGGADNG